jgi:hypothetical protein
VNSATAVEFAYPSRHEDGGRQASRLLAVLGCWLLLLTAAASAEEAAHPSPHTLQVGFARADITPRLEDGKSSWLAGYGWGRAATGVHDPLFARTAVISDGTRRVALVAVDLVGMQLPEVERIRERLPDCDYVLVCSTHNHEGPDTIGLWGRTPLHRGVDDDYLTMVVDRVVASVRTAARSLQPATAEFGTAVDESLLGDSRLPQVKDGVLRAVRFNSFDGDSTRGVIVQWNCHPESLGSDNTLITADFCHWTISRLEESLACPVVYVSGAVGGLMAPPDGRFTDEDGRALAEGDFAFAQAYGQAVADLAGLALKNAQPIDLVPVRFSTSPVAVPLDNPLYRAARLAGVLRREAVGWTGDFRQANLPVSEGKSGHFAVRSEVACLRFGELYVASIPGEIYPELVYGKFQDPAEAHVDFPDAPLEPTVQQMMPTDKWMLLGLANDEIGYIIPRRQWDREPPFAYGRNKSQYGEINSCSPHVAPVIMEALGERIRAMKSEH